MSHPIYGTPSNIYIITVAFCPAIQLARCYKKYFLSGNGIFVVMGHYPINKEKNNRDIKMYLEDRFGVNLLDPGYDMGSAQSQWWALQQIRGLQDHDYWINLDPDSGYTHEASDWSSDAAKVLDKDPNCILISCMSPLVESFLKERNIELEIKEISWKEYPKRVVRYGIARQPVPFNLSMWRYSFFKELGGIPQVGEKWGEVEGPVFHHAQQRGKYHAYLLDCMEDESGKYMQDRQLLEYKDRYMRTDGPERFVGSYTEYLRLYYPHLLEMDTCIPENTVFK